MSKCLRNYDGFFEKIILCFYLFWEIFVYVEKFIIKIWIFFMEIKKVNGSFFFFLMGNVLFVVFV